ncbi:MAG TPA: DUF881 domain-containing protein [Clostridiales bacterium]|nr:DUF881 domain-containing protein [Clostridiales bacterium]
MKARTGQYIALMLVSVILGIVLAIQFKSVQKVGGSVSLQRAQELSNKVQRLTEENESLENQIKEFQQRIKEYEDAAQDVDKITDTMYKELERIRILAGLSDVEGPGIVVTVDMKTQTIDEFTGTINTITDEDLLRIVNELNAAGAEAISINEERIVSTTEIRNAGRFININTNSYSTPFIIKAIGDPNNLESALMLIGGVVDYFNVINISIDIKKHDKIIIPKYKGNLENRFAQPILEGK